MTDAGAVQGRGTPRFEDVQQPPARLGRDLPLRDGARPPPAARGRGPPAVLRRHLVLPAGREDVAE
jgi:hypothetical protein